ncbi:MAG: VOC family protein [Planctomycetaceae bacterium]|jgi:PhnB protein|nr:VOC family protein [Planctomycetaceae bacterium]MBT6157936.1 VOC family protein [Planctomycetaceae bacterium]MBT6487462.1 VOC family protein [Planctomycetaceae bacterium]MBT6495563.1 VOC family protein [Planctomycetaceae bacterium]
MSDNVKPIPDGYHTVTPYIIVNDAVAAIEFYQQAFGAKELLRLEMPDGKIGHAEIKIGDSVIMMADECPEMGAVSPKSLGGSAGSIMLYVEDVDASFAQAVESGATIKRPLTDQFYGDRSGTLEDPFGHGWTIATHVEDVSPGEIDRRFEEMMKQPKPD